MLINSKGFSAIELLLVVSVMAILGAVALPQVRNAQADYRLTSTANDVIGQLNQARIMAITRNADFRVSVTSSTAYAVQQETSTNVWTTISSYTLPTGFTITATNTGEFHSRGTASPNGTFTVTNSNSKTRQVLVDPSGRVYAQ